MLNKAILIGRLTADPELKSTQNSNVSVCSFTIAVDRGYAKAGEKRQADFIDIVAWRQTAEFVSKYFAKGQMIAVEGSIQTRSYTDNAGNKRKVFEVVAEAVHFCGSNTTTKPDATNTANNAAQTVGEVVEEEFAEVSDGDLLF